MERISSFDDLQAALTNGTTEIILTRGIVATHSFVLADGVSLTGEAQENGELPTLAFMFSDDVVTYMIDGGQVDAIDIKGAVSAAGNKSQLAVVENGGASPSITTKAS